MSRARDVLPGVVVCVAIAIVATVIGSVLPVLGSAIPAVVIGVVIALVRRPVGRVAPGVAYASRFLLQCAVVLLGAQLSIGAVLKVGAESLPVMLSSLLVCLVGASLIGRWMGIDRDLRVLIGVGTGICGASAIAAVAPVVRATQTQIAYAVSTIFLFNVFAISLFPLVGHAVDMSPHAFGLFAGTAVNDTSSVVAAASVYSSAALGFAVVVKLVRTLMIIPISIGLAIGRARREGGGERMRPRRAVGMVPWFLVGFLVVVALNSTAVFAPPVVDGLQHASVFLIAVALAGIGLSTNPRAIASAGWRPLALGAILWVLVASTALAMMWVTGALG
jgi:uncharacterized integral membrane protein (TIGR00698 family)